MSSGRQLKMQYLSFVYDIYDGSVEHSVLFFEQTVTLCKKDTKKNTVIFIMLIFGSRLLYCTILNQILTIL